MLEHILENNVAHHTFGTYVWKICCNICWKICLLHFKRLETMLEHMFVARQTFGKYYRNIFLENMLENMLENVL